MRARNIKPGFFKNEYLAELDPIERLLFVGLWCFADKEGRFEWRPKKIKAEIFPYDNMDIEASLNVITSNGFIIKYSVEGVEYGEIVNFKKHQNPHPHEARSKIPERNQCDDIPRNVTCEHVKCTADSLIPDSLIPDSDKSMGGTPIPPDEPKPEKPKSKKFIPPTIEEIAAYCSERNNGIDPVKFFNHYEANGWMRGKNKIKDWKACVRTWEGNQRGQPRNSPSTGNPVTDQNLRAGAEFLSED